MPNSFRDLIWKCVKVATKIILLFLTTTAVVNRNIQKFTFVLNLMDPLAYLLYNSYFLQFSVTNL